MNQKNYCQAIANIHGILKLWRMRDLSIKGKIAVFKTLAISKLVYLALLKYPITPSGVLTQFIWYNSYFKTDSKAVYLKSFSTKNINFITQLFNTDGSVKNWNILKTECALQNKHQFCSLQLINAIAEIWKKCIKQTSENTSLLVVKDHDLIRGSRIIILEKLSPKELSSLLFLQQSISRLHKNILIIYFQILNYLGKRST